MRTFGKPGLLSQGILAIFGAANMENPAIRMVQGLGGRPATAARFGVSPEAVRQWLRRGIPADRALDAEEATAGTEYAVTANEVLRFLRGWLRERRDAPAPAREPPRAGDEAKAMK